jgi:hypothetical protein
MVSAMGDCMEEREARSVTDGASITRSDKSACLNTVFKPKLNAYIPALAKRNRKA